MNKVLALCLLFAAHAQAQTCTASSEQGTTYTAQMACDGNTATRWSSAFSEPQWLQVDLGSVQPITSVALTWETALGRDYDIRISSDGIDWQAFPIRGNAALSNAVTINTPARYVRMQGIVRGTVYGFSIYEITVSGSTPAPPTPTPGNAKINWTRPTLYTDGTPLPASAIIGYRIYYGSDPNSLTQSVDVPGDALTYTFTGLAVGTYYFAMTTRTSSGESSRTNITTMTVETPTVPPPTPPTTPAVYAVPSTESRIIVFGVLTNNGVTSRSATVGGYVPVGTLCIGEPVYTYRGASYRRVPQSAVSWWNTTAGTEWAAPCR